MGIFREFPYTNFHEMNLDWILKQLRGMDEKLDEALDLIENKITDLVNEPEIRAEIERIVEDYLTPEQIDTIIERLTTEEIEPLKEEITDYIENTPFNQPFPDYIPIANTKCKLINDDTNRVTQGSCCDNNYYYVYRSNYYGGAGVIDKYNMNNVKYASTDFVSDNDGGASSSPVD